VTVTPSNERPIVLFDGDCGFCNRSVVWILRHDPEGVFRFLPIQSPNAPNALGRAADLLDEDSMIYTDGSRALLRSEAILAILARLPRPWRWLRAFRFLPRGPRDAAYRFVAKHRKKLARRKGCPIPTPAERTRILD